MNATSDLSIEFLCAFECGPMVAYLLTGCERPKLRKQYRAWLIARTEAACNHLEAIPEDLRESKPLERLSTLVYHVTAADVDRAREREHLQSAFLLFEEILAERGGR